LFGDNESGERNTLLFHPIIKLLQQQYAKNISRLIAVSRITKKLAVEHLKVQDGKVDLIYNGVDIDLFHPPQNEEVEERFSQPTVVYIGRMVGKKGIQLLINSIPEVLHNVPEARFVFAGSGNLPLYRKVVEEAGIPKNNVSFVGYLGYFERSEILRGATVFVNPSYFENCSISILEAMSSGCAVVAHDVGGNPELIESETNGFLVPLFDYVKLAESISLLLKDENFNRKIGKEARKTVEKSFSSKKCAEETFRLYKRLLDGSF
jgi:glycosyltransferase involved in cell wall biosynthesis